MSDPTILEEWITLCVKNEQLIQEFDRLKGTDLAGRSTPITQMIDKATGKFEQDALMFFDFCMNLYFRIPRA